MNLPFAFDEVAQLHPQHTQDPHFVSATDSVQLAYYPFLPAFEPQAIVINYHGAGLYSNHLYQWMAEQSANNGVGMYLVDIRGHGHSEGPRGDAPSIEQVMRDVQTMVDFVAQKHPNARIYLMGHSSGAAVVLNYNSWRPINQAAGYIFLAPYLGPFSGTTYEHKNPEKNFIKKARVWVYILGGITGNRLCAHTKSVFFNYPEELIKQDPLIVTSYTYTMSCATTAHNAQQVFKDLHKPFWLLIGKEDEQFIPEKVISFKELAPSHALSSAQIVPHAQHLSILKNAPGLIAQALLP